MSALVSIFNQGDRTKMPPISSELSSDSIQSQETTKKPCNGDTNTKVQSIFPPRMSSKKKLKWSIEKNKQENSNENEKDKPSDIQSRLSSKSASSFFNSKPVIVIPRSKDDNSEDKNKSSLQTSKVANLTQNFEKRGIDSEDQRYLSPYCLSEDESCTTTSQSSDKTLARSSTGSIMSHIEKVVGEILKTERTYVKNLQEIIEGYLKCMRMKNCPISKTNVSHLFINIEKIFDFNREFLKKLENADDDPVEIAQCFVDNEKGFQTYTDYCTKYPKSVEILTECTRQRESATFIQEIQMSLGHSLPLGSYLLKPVQRILKYHLLLQEMKKHFDKENDIEGYEIICDALFAMTGVAKHINEMKRQHEATLHLQEIQSQLSEFEGPDLTTYGNLVLEDSFRVVGTRTDRYLFLFEKILLITKKRERENGYTCKASLLLSNMMMTESIPKEPLAFQIIRFDNQKVNYSFVARNMEQKSKWSLELKRLLVESLVAEVPLKAKALILGEKNVDDEINSLESDSQSRKGQSPSVSRRQSLKGSPSSQSLSKKRFDLDSTQSKEDENNNPRDDLRSASDVFINEYEMQGLSNGDQNEHSVGARVQDWERRHVESVGSEDDNITSEEGITYKRQRKWSLDNDLPRPRQHEKSGEGRIKSTGGIVEFPWIPKRTSSSKLLEARLAREKSASTSELQSESDENIAISPALAPTDSEIDMTRRLDDITENSKIHKTVRDVAKAFSEPLPSLDHPVLNMRDNNSKVPETSDEQGNKKEKRSIDELLASIDRELDETRRTINSAQLLESAIRLKQVQPLKFIWPPVENSDQGTQVDSVDSDTKSTQHENQALNSPVQSQSPAGRSAPSTMQNKGNKEQGEEEEERDIKAELAAFEKQAANVSKFPITDFHHRTCSLDRRRGKKVFELPRSPKIERYSTGDLEESSSDQAKTVYNMARRYSKKISDERTVRDIRSRFRPDISNVIEKFPLKVDVSPQMKVERVTKVTFDKNLEGAKVIRRRRKSGSRKNRASWSHENAKVDVELLRLKIERPRSLHEIKPPKELIDLDKDNAYLFPDGLDEGLEPALLAGMQKDDVVVKGLVKHLVHKFGSDDSENIGHNVTHAGLL